MERLCKFKRARATLEFYVKTNLSHLVPTPTPKKRALRALHVAHLVAPTPQAKGKIERSFQTFQIRLVTLMAHAKVSDWEPADSILQMEIQRQGRKTLRTTGRIPSEVWEEQLLKRTARMRPTPAPTLLDLHFSLRATRKVQTGPYLEFDGLYNDDYYSPWE